MTTVKVKGLGIVERPPQQKVLTITIIPEKQRLSLLYSHDFFFQNEYESSPVWTYLPGTK